ncbi:MAG: hypothetical protein ACE5GX_01085 [Thermoanaerobaculia bacterium]
MTHELPPAGRPPGVLDLLESTDEHPLDPAWRADALGRSRHSRLADEVRNRVDDSDPGRAELVCARIAREALGDYAPALILLSKERRRRAQALAAWTATLFDLALRPGLAGLDGDRLAQINAWEFQTEEALEGDPPGQPVFVMLARVGEGEPWPREALDRIVAAARRVAMSGGDVDADTAEAIVEALCGTGSAAPEIREALVPLVEAALSSKLDVSSVDLTFAPLGWRHAAGYVRRVCELHFAGERQLGVKRRLALLAASVLRPR